MLSNPGQGGSVYFSCNREFEDCSLKIQESTFTNSSAHYEGGAIKWTVIMPEVELTEELFSQNKAGFYGDNIACYAQKIAKLSEAEY